MRAPLRHAAGAAAFVALLVAATPAPVAGAAGEREGDGASVSQYFGRRLARVEWPGRAALPAAALESATGWRAGAVFDTLAWARLAERVAARYAEAGHLAAGVEAVHFDTASAGLEVRVSVHEGPPFRIGEVRVYGGGAEPEVQCALGLASGEPWSTARVEQALTGLVERYRNESRPFTRVHVRSLRPEGDLAHLEIVVLESDTVWVDSVRVEGLGATSPGLVRRLATEVAGKPFDPRRAEGLRRRLLGLGVFASVEGPVLEPASRRRAVLVYRVEELLANAASGALGYQGRSAKPSGLAELTLGNLAGTARRADLGWQGRGDAGSNFHLAYREPLLPLFGLRAEAAFEHELYDTTYVRTRGSVDLLSGGGANWEVGAGLALERVVSGAAGAQHSDRTEYSLRGAAGFLDEPASRGTRVALRGAYAHTGDHLASGESVSGVLWTGSAEVRHAGAAGGRRTYRMDLEAEGRTAAGQPVSVADQFSLGGVSTLRGYREDAYRTVRYALARGELAFGAKDTRPFLFFDQALFAAPTGPSTGVQEIRYRVGYGAGLSQRTGGGRLGLVLAWGEGTRPLDAKLHLAFATRF